MVTLAIIVSIVIVLVVFIPIIIIVWKSSDKEIPALIRKIDNMLQRLVQKCRKNIDILPLVPNVYNDDAEYKRCGEQLRKDYNNPDVLNIAITGSTSVGKSSFVKTYEANHTWPFCKYLYLNMKEYKTEDKNGLTQEAVESYFLMQVQARVHKNDLLGSVYKPILDKPKASIVLIVFIVVALCGRGLVFFEECWKALVPRQYDGIVKGGIFIVILVIGAIKIVTYILHTWECTFIKIGHFPIESEMRKRKQKVFDENTRELIYALKRMRWGIGYTVVFDEMENILADRDGIKIYKRLKELNKLLNDNILSYRFFRLEKIRKPVRFLYVYRNEVSKKIDSEKFFDDIIPLGDRLTVDNVFSIIEKKMKAAMKTGRYRRMTDSGDIFHFDADYMSNVGEWLLDDRRLNRIMKTYFDRWASFTDRLGSIEPVADDPKRLFSFVLYEQFFPDDKKGFKRRDCLALKAKSEEDLNELVNCNDKERKLFLYLIKECPESYRITDLCMRFVAFDPSLLNTHLDDFERAKSKDNYEVALEYITKVICCDPENWRHYNERARILEKLGRNEEAEKDRQVVNKLQPQISELSL